LDIFHEWITIDFHDKLTHGNLRVSGGGQVDCDRTGKMSSRKISGKWASAGTRLKRLRKTGGAGGIVSSNASLTRDEPGTRMPTHRRRRFHIDTEVHCVGAHPLFWPLEPARVKPN